MNVFIFHGTGGSPEGNWFPWLERELKRLGFVPYKKYVNQESVFVGHSMGATLALRLLEKRTTPILGSILAAPFHDELHLGEEFDVLLRSFINHPFDWEKIKSNCGRFVIFDGDNDPYVPLEQPQFIAQKLGARLNIIPGGKHLNGEAGWFEFPQLLAEIKKLVQD